MSKQRTLLSILQAVTYSTTISEIADRLYLSQPYVSRILKDEEAKYDVTLVDRKAKPIALTKFGSSVLTNLKKIASAEDSLTTSLENLKSQQARPIRISNSNPFLTDYLATAIADYVEQHPDTVIELTRPAERNVANNLNEGAIDIVIDQRWNAANILIADLPSPVYYLPLFAQCRPFNPDVLTLPFEKNTLTGISHCRYVGLSGHSEFQAYVDSLFKRVGIQPRNKLFLPTPASALQTVAKLPNATTITTRKIAALNLPAHQYNLIPLPTNFIRTDTSIMCLQTASAAVQGLTAFLTAELTRSIQ
ncbi:LysR family transcriptional regulator [Levilactobacillus yiduensis]|uniref:LysR family transcriptional regulator n=1 Tax=Levilactobacillus yiduensis TaxID=2953880 RepID=UPI000EF3003D|nr:LysR family transcriptional regulator [Levilactobacillus yiduensis]AYM01900.1 LysR family transcriptional regulator [Levilactobacillus brevis]